MVNAKGKMFKDVSATWNPLVGCKHYCVYCWAKEYVEKKLKYKFEKYKQGFFKPRFIEKELKKKNFPKAGMVFVVDMGDLFGEWVPKKIIQKIIDVVEQKQENKFLFLTKNPKRYFKFTFPSNAILGATIETNDDELYVKHKISRAPLPSERIKAMIELDHEHKFVSIEPILDFKFDEFIEQLVEINPETIYVGYDNYNHKLPEPPMDKTLRFVKVLREEKGLNVRTKTIRFAWYEE